MFRTVALLCTGLALTGCSSYQQVLGSLSSSEEVQASSQANEPSAPTARSEAGTERLSVETEEAAESARPRRMARRATPTTPANVAPAERRPSVDELAQVQKSTADQPRQPAASRLSTLPRVGSPEWEKQQAEIERKEKRLDQMIRSICRGC